MKYLIPICLLLASCGASHKFKQSQSRKMDSVVSTTKDTNRVTHEESSTSNINAKDVHITVTFPPEEQSQASAALQDAQQRPTDRTSLPPAKKTGNKVVDAIQDAIAAAGSAGRLPATVKIDIGSISDSSTRQVKRDSVAVHATTQAQVHTEQESKSKEVTRQGMPVSARFGLWLLILAVIAAVIYRYRGKFVALKTIILSFLKVK